MSEELKSVLDNLDKVGQKLDQVSNDNTASINAIKSEIKSLGDKQLELSKELAAMQQTASQQIESQKSAETSSIGDKFTATKSFQNLAQDVRSVRGAREIISTKTGPTPTTTTVAVGDSITRNTVAAPYLVGGIVSAPEQPLLIEGLIPHVPVSSGAINYVENKTFSNGAAGVAEGAAKPETTFAFALKTATVATLAHWTKITEQLAADAPAVSAFINAKMLYGLQYKVDRELVVGQGGNSLSGLLNSGNYTDYSSAVTVPTGATLIDFALLIKTKLEELAYAPRYLVLNPADWAALALLKDTQKRYLLGGPATVAEKTLWGLKVITTSAMTSGKFLMADFGLGATIYDRQEVAIEIDREQDDFTKNLFTIRAERRLALVVDSPAAIAGGNWALSE